VIEAIVAGGREQPVEARAWDLTMHDGYVNKAEGIVTEAVTWEKPPGSE
jgi:hypothetical protein